MTRENRLTAGLPLGSLAGIPLRLAPTWLIGSGSAILCRPSYTEKTPPAVNSSSATRNDQKYKARPAR